MNAVGRNAQIPPITSSQTTFYTSQIKSLYTDLSKALKSKDTEKILFLSSKINAIAQQMSIYIEGGATPKQQEKFFKLLAHVAVLQGAVDAFHSTGDSRALSGQLPFQKITFFTYMKELFSKTPAVDKGANAFFKESSKSVDQVESKMNAALKLLTNSQNTELGVDARETVRQLKDLKEQVQVYDNRLTTKQCKNSQAALVIRIQVLINQLEEIDKLSSPILELRELSQELKDITGSSSKAVVEGPKYIRLSRMLNALEAQHPNNPLIKAALSPVKAALSEVKAKMDLTTHKEGLLQEIHGAPAGKLSALLGLNPPSEKNKARALGIISKLQAQAITEMDPAARSVAKERVLALSEKIKQLPPNERKQLNDAISSNGMIRLDDHLSNAITQAITENLAIPILAATPPLTPPETAATPATPQGEKITFASSGRVEHIRRERVLGSGGLSVVTLVVDTFGRVFALKEAKVVPNEHPLLTAARKEKTASELAREEVIHKRLLATSPSGNRPANVQAPPHRITISGETAALYAVEKGDLRDFQTRNFRQPEYKNWVLNLFGGLLSTEGVQAFVKAGVFHRDLKTENLFWNTDDSNRVVGKVGDVGGAILEKGQPIELSAPSTLRLTSGQDDAALKSLVDAYNQAVISGDTAQQDLLFPQIQELTTQMMTFSMGMAFFEMLTNQDPFPPENPSIDAYPIFNRNGRDDSAIQLAQLKAAGVSDELANNIVAMLGKPELRPNLETVRASIDKPSIEEFARIESRLNSFEKNLKTEIADPNKKTAALDLPTKIAGLKSLQTQIASTRCYTPEARAQRAALLDKLDAQINSLVTVNDLGRLLDKLKDQCQELVAQGSNAIYRGPLYNGMVGNIEYLRNQSPLMQPVLDLALAARSAVKTDAIAKSLIAQHETLEVEGRAILIERVKLLGGGSFGDVYEVRVVGEIFTNTIGHKEVREAGLPERMALKVDKQGIDHAQAQRNAAELKKEQDLHVLLRGGDPTKKLSAIQDRPRVVKTQNGSSAHLYKLERGDLTDFHSNFHTSSNYHKGVYQMFDGLLSDEGYQRFIDAGIFYPDIKLANMLWSMENGRVVGKVSDVGGSVLEEGKPIDPNLLRTNSTIPRGDFNGIERLIADYNNLVNTPNKTPEQLEQQKRLFTTIKALSQKIMSFSIGVAFYRLLTGERAFKKDASDYPIFETDSSEKQKQVLKAKGVPDELANKIVGMLSPFSSQRPTLAEVRQAIPPT